MSDTCYQGWYNENNCLVCDECHCRIQQDQISDSADGYCCNACYDALDD